MERNVIVYICYLMLGLTYSVGLEAQNTAKSKVESTTMTDNESAMYTSRLIPSAKNTIFRAGKFFEIKDACKISVFTTEPLSLENREIISKLIRQYWDVSAELEFSKNEKTDLKKNGAYVLESSPDCMEIASPDFSGVLNALKTARQLSESTRGTTKFSSYMIPQCSINDEPFFDFRGIHLCVFSSTRARDIEKMIRLASYYKMNYAVIEFWGTAPFKDYKCFSFPNKEILSRDEISRLVKLSKELGIMLIPQFNMLGHSSGDSERHGRHATLSFHKDMQNYFEPEGWSWCLSNVDTRNMLKNMMLDLLDLFGNPPYFHIGFDEAYEAGTCMQCRKTARKDLLLDWIKELRTTAQTRNARIMMWHDMLLIRDDPRWDGYVAFGHEYADELRDALPRDIVICDWEYFLKKGVKDGAWSTFKEFKSKGFETLACPWHMREEMVKIGRGARENGLNGILATVWYDFNIELCEFMFTQNANEEWGAYVPNLNGKTLRIMRNHHLHQIDWDMGCDAYEEAGGRMD